MVGFAGWYDNQPYRDILFFVPFVHSLFIGPVLYFYIISIFNYEFRITGIKMLHLLPGILYFVYATGTGLIDFFVFDRYNLTNEYEDPDFASWYKYLSIGSVFFYLFLAIRYYHQYKKYAVIATSFADQASMKWLRTFLYTFAMISLMPLIETLLSNFDFFTRLRYFGPWYYFCGFAIVVYYIAINAYQAVYLPLYKIQFNPQMLEPFETVEVKEEIKEQSISLVSEDSKKTSEKMMLIKNGLITLMEDELLFERSDLTLTEVARKLNTNAVILSKAVNQQFGLNFNDFINQYRVNAVIRRLALPEFKNQTLLAIAFDAGFNSKATFNRSFKKFTGKNPKEYL